MVWDPALDTLKTKSRYTLHRIVENSIHPLPELLLSRYIFLDMIIEIKGRAVELTFKLNFESSNYTIACFFKSN